MANEKFAKNKAFLIKYRIIMSKVDRLENQLARLDDRKLGMSSIKLSDEPKGTRTYTINDLMVQSEATFNRINKYMYEARKAREKIEDVICALDSQLQADVLEMYFIERLPLDNIADTLGYSERHVQRMYYRGVILCDISQMS